MRIPFTFASCLLLALPLRAAPPRVATIPKWPALAEQLAKDQVRTGSALEQLIADNQDFRLLRPEEASDTLGLPPWLRVVYRKDHVGEVFSGLDPTGGYPRVLKDIHAWMLSHQDLDADLPGAALGIVVEPGLPPETAPNTTTGTDLRISGARTTPRSESSIQVDFWNTSRIIAASNAIQSSGQQAQFYSSDGGATWGQTTLPFTSNDRAHSDPTVDWTSNQTGWATTLGIAGSRSRGRAYRSSDFGATWVFDDTFSGNQRSVDKQMTWADHSASSPYKDTVYATWHDGNQAYFNRRTGLGWQTPVQVSGTETTGTAIGGDVKTNGAGNVFVFWPTTGNRRLVVRKSINGGASFGTPVILATTYDSYDIGVPSFASRRALIYVSGGAYANNVYAAWTDLTGASTCDTPIEEPGTNVNSDCKTRIWFARSTSGGAIWEAKRMINNQASRNDQYNQWLVVDEATGRIAVIYYDTVNDAGRHKTDVWYQSSADGGVTWSAASRVSTAMTDETCCGADGGNQYGDYNGLSGYNNAFFPSWTDRRSSAREEIWTAKINEP